MSAALLEDLGAALGRAGGTLVTDPEVMAGHAVDATGRFGGGAPVAVARPRDAEGVAAVVRGCLAHRVPYVVQGGNTGLVGAGVPGDGELVLDLRGLDAVGAVDGDALQLTAGAGATLAAVHRAAEAAGCEFPIDHGARDTATVGGMAATNAGGPLALRHGSMRARVAGLDAVLPGGAVVSRSAGLLKDNAGYDLTELLVGSEGTLGVITAVRLALVPATPFRLTALFGVGGMGEALGLLRTLRRAPGLEACDVFDAAGMCLVCAHRRLEPPIGESEVYVIAQFAAGRDVTEDVVAVLDEVPGDPEVVAATSRADRAALWTYREAMNESIRALGAPHKLDVGLPIAALPAFDAELRRRIGAEHPGWRLFNYGHLGDGNLHVNVVGPDPDDERVDALVLRCAAGFGGTISAEHGVGRAKRQWLDLCRGAGDIAAMRAIKTGLDPYNLLAPGRVLPDPTEGARA